MSVEPILPVPIDVNKSAKRLAEAIRIKTISYQDRSRIDGTEFLQMHRYLEQAFPHVHATLTREVVNDYSLLYSWKGSSDELNPSILMAHLDVV